MPGPKRVRRERTDEWASIQQRTLWPEQELYEQIRPIVLYHETAGERAKEIDVPQRTLSRKADEFERYGMQSLFASEEQGGARETSKTLPPDMRQLIVDLRAELPTMSWREIAEICYIRYGRRPAHHSVKHIATAGPPPSLQARRYQPWHLIADPAERKLAVIRLHSEGWSITSIAEYMQTTRPTIYATLQRWMEEGVAGLEEKSKARKRPRKATLQVRNEIRKLQQNPLLGEFRVHTALLREGIEVSPATCGRIMAANRQVYGIQNPERQARPKLEMPFKAVRRHQYWSCDVRYIEEHLLPDPRPVYVITIFENFSRMVLSSTISPTQNQWDYLAVLVDAIRRYGAPEAIVTDGGGIFYSTMALELYEMLGIRKERIEAGEPWQNYAETLLYVMWNLENSLHNLDPEAARRPQLLQRTDLAANPAGAPNLVDQLQSRTSFRPSCAPGRAAQSRGRVAWRAGTHLPRRGPLSCALCDAIYSLARCSWLCPLQKLAVLWRRRPGG